MFERPIHLLQPAFSRGEVSPRLFGRVDLAGWMQSLRTLRNGSVTTEGTAMNRQGFGLVGNSVTNTALGSILIPFTFSATQSYVIEVSGNGTAQVFSQGAPVAIANNVPITAAAFLHAGVHWYIEITTSAPHGLSQGQNCTISGVVGTGAFALLNASQTVTSVIDATHFTVNTNAAGLTGTYTSGGVVNAQLTFATPWNQAALSKLRWSQSANTLTVTHPNYPTQEIVRNSATSFSCSAPQYNLGPFLPQNADGVTFVYASAKSGTVTLTSTAPIFNANHVGALFQLTQQDLSIIVPWEAQKQLGTVSSLNATPIYRRASLKNYKSVSAVDTNGSDTVTTGSWIPSHSYGVQADGDGGNIPDLGFGGVNWEYQDSGYGVVQITGYVSATQVTGIVQPNYPGGPGLLPLSCVGGPQVTVGPLTFSGTGSATSFGPLTAMTSTDPSKYYVTIGGVYQSPALYSITAAGGNIVFLSPPPAGTNNISVSQITALGQTTYWAFGAFSPDQGYPQTVSYFPDRLVLASTPQQPVGVFGSVTSQYHQFSVSNPVVASDAFTAFLNARQLNAISDLIPLSDLLVGTTNITWRLWAGSTGTALGPLSIAATPQSYYGQSPNCAAVLFGDSAIYPEYDGRRLRDLIYQFAFDKFMGQELTLYSRHLIPYGTQIVRLAYKPDASGQLVFALRSDGLLLVCTYLREQQIIGWAHWDTTGGVFEDICVVPETQPAGTLGYSLYALTNRTIAGIQARYVERLQVREVTTPYDWKFLDCAITYDGRNTSGAISMTVTGGTTWAAGDVGVVTANTASGWSNFQSTDPTLNNEIWLTGSINFQVSVGQSLGGVSTVPLTAGAQYQVLFPTGESRTLTVAADGVTCTWQNPIASGFYTSCTFRARCLITGYTSATQVSVRFRDPIPAQLQAVPVTAWTFARTTFYGATQLASAPISALVDGQVLGMHSTSTYPDGSITVTSGGQVMLPCAGGVVQVGLPYLFDLETLPLNLQGQETIRMRAKTDPVIYLDITETRNFLAGPDFTNMMPNKARAYEPYVSQMNMLSGVTWTRVPAELDAECHVCIRQNMPLPITIRAVIPQANIGEPIS